MSRPNCPDCSRLMVPRYARRGPNAGHHFWGCSDYPECTGTRDMDTPDCPECGSDMVPRKATRGQNAGNYFFGCKDWSTTGCKGIIDV